MATPIQSCQVPVSTFFVFQSESFQNAADTVYLNKNSELLSSISGVVAPGTNHGARLIFRSDFERMQYLLGNYGRFSGRR